MKLYRIQKVTPDGDVLEEVEVRAGTADEAVSSVVSGALYRGTRGQHAVLRAKVYGPAGAGATTLVRFYERSPDHKVRGKA